MLLLAFNLPCRMPEFISDPSRFDVDRFAPGCDEGHRPVVFVPSGTGRHFCLGAGLAEVLCALDVAVAAREVDALPSHPRPQFELKLKREFAMQPKYQFRLLGRRVTN